MSSLNTHGLEDEESKDSSPNKTDAATHASRLTASTQCAASFFLWFNSWGIVNAFGSYQAYYAARGLSGVSIFDITWIGSLQLSLLGIVGIVASKLLDAGYVRAVVLVSHLLTVLGLMTTSLASEYWQLILSQGLCVGLGIGGLFTSSVSTLPTHFEESRALAVAIASTGASIGAVVYSIIFSHLQPLIGFAWTTRIIAFIVILTGIFPILAVRSHASLKRTHSLVDTNAFREWPFTLFEIGTFVYFLGMYVPFFFAQILFESQDHVSRHSAQYLIPLLNAGSFLGRLASGMLADRFGVFNTNMLCMSATLATVFAWLAVHDTPGAYAFCFFYGLVSGATATLNPATLATLCAPGTAIGARMGMNLVIFGLGALFGNPLAAALLRSSAGSVGLIAFCGACVAASLGFIVAARTAKGGLHATKV